MNYNKKSVEDIDVKGKRVLCRCDFNVPTKEGKITSDKRIVAAMPTIEYLVNHGARVILCSHMGKPKGEWKPELSLQVVADRLSELLGKPVVMAKDVVGEDAKAKAAALKDGDVMLLTTDQSSHTTLHECSLLLGTKKIKVENQLVGGGFGGKEDMSVQHHAALITYVTHLPVKVKLSRAESLLVHPKRHPFWMDFTIGCDENGIIQGVAAEVIGITSGSIGEALYNAKILFSTAELLAWTVVIVLLSLAFERLFLWGLARVESVLLERSGT